MSSYEYDPGDVDVLLNHLLAFEKYLQRYKNDMQHVSGVFTTFIGYATKLLKANKAEAENLLTELKNAEHFPGTTWLIAQLSQKAKSGSKTTAPQKIG
mgnify:CR=1 FL=1